MPAVQTSLAARSSKTSVTECRCRKQAVRCQTPTVQIALQLLAGVPHGTYVECFADPDREPVWQTMWANRPAIRNGTMEVGKEPAFGIRLDWKMVEKYRIA